MFIDFKQIISITLILFSVIDILGSLPLIISMKKKGINIQSFKATLAAAILMISFLFIGEKILQLFGVDIASFAIAGALVIFLIGLEMILGINLFKDDPNSNSSSIVPIAFPLVAGAGTLTTILTLKAQYNNLNLMIGIVVNLIIVYLVLRSSDWIQSKIGKNGEDVLRKIFGIILLAIAVKIFKANWGM